MRFDNHGQSRDAQIFQIGRFGWKETRNGIGRRIEQLRIGINVGPTFDDTFVNNRASGIDTDIGFFMVS